MSQYGEEGMNSILGRRLASSAPVTPQTQSVRETKVVYIVRDSALVIPQTQSVRRTKVIYIVRDSALLIPQTQSVRETKVV